MKFSRKSTTRIIAIAASVFAIHGVAASFVMRELGIHPSPISVSQNVLSSIQDRNADRLYHAMPVAERESTGTTARELGALLAWYDRSAQGCDVDRTVLEDSKTFGSITAEMVCKSGSHKIGAFAQSVNGNAPEGAVLPTLIYAGLEAKYDLHPGAHPSSSYFRGMAHAIEAEAPALRAVGFEGVTGFDQSYKFVDWNQLASKNLAIAERLEAREMQKSGV